MLSGPRLRQVALVARDCDQVADELSRTFGWAPPFHDPGVGQFGLTNAVFAAGDTFVEVVAPVQAGTTAGRYLERRGGDGGYMAIFQVPDLAAARRRVAGLGVRVVWTADLPDIGGSPPASRGRPRRHRVPGLGGPGAVVAVGGPGVDRAGARPCPRRRDRADDRGQRPGRGGAALGGGARDPRADGDHTVTLEASGQRLRFVPAQDGRGEGITEVTIAGLPGGGPWEIGGVRFTARKDDMTALDTGTEELLAEIEDGVAVITMNRPHGATPSPPA